MLLRDIIFQNYCHSPYRTTDCNYCISFNTETAALQQHTAKPGCPGVAGRWRQQSHHCAPLISPSRKMQSFCDCCRQKSLIIRYVFLKNAMEYAGHLYSFMQWNCGNLQKLRFDKKDKKSDCPLFSLGYYLNVKSHFLLLPMISKLHHRKCWEYLSSHLVLFQILTYCSNLHNTDESDKFCSFT